MSQSDSILKTPLAVKHYPSYFKQEHGSYFIKLVSKDRFNWFKLKFLVNGDFELSRGSTEIKQGDNMLEYILSLEKSSKSEYLEVALEYVKDAITIKPTVEKEIKEYREEMIRD